MTEKTDTAPAESSASANDHGSMQFEGSEGAKAYIECSATQWSAN